MDTNTITGKVLYSVRGPESNVDLESLAQAELVRQFGREGRNFWVDADGDENGIAITFGFESSLDRRTIDARMDEIGEISTPGEYGSIEFEFEISEIF